jgi:tRNA pseudouridine38-40 synthase
MSRSVLRLTLAYDGAGFAGSQIQPGERTVQGELERVLVALGGLPGTTVFAGRTDRGVHAAGQVVGSADPLPDGEPERLARALNARLPPDAAVVGLERTRDGFHARYDARWREYRYRAS